jgi:hypothetical protein
MWLGTRSLAAPGQAADDLPDRRHEEQLPGHRLKHCECPPASRSSRPISRKSPRRARARARSCLPRQRSSRGDATTGPRRAEAHSSTRPAICLQAQLEEVLTASDLGVDDAGPGPGERSDHQPSLVPRYSAMAAGSPDRAWAIIRPWRTGTRSFSRVRFCSSSRATGSGRSAAGTHPHDPAAASAPGPVLPWLCVGQCSDARRSALTSGITSPSDAALVGDRPQARSSRTAAAGTTRAEAARPKPLRSRWPYPAAA